MAVKALRKIQIGTESVAGTAVAASAIWRGEGTIEDTSKVVFSVEDVGSLMPPDRSYIPQYDAQLAMKDSEATFEQLGYILNAGLGAATKTNDATTVTVYNHAYSFATTSAITPVTYTLEAGDDNEEEEAAYCYVKDFSLSGKPGEAVKVSANWHGRQLSSSTFTNSLSLVTVEEILFGNGKLYLDAIGGTIGSTLKSNTLIGFTLKVTTGLTPVYTADGGLYFAFVKQVRPEVVCEVTFEHNGTATAEKAFFRSQTSRQMRLRFIGSLTGNPTSTGPDWRNKALTIDLVGKWKKFAALDESNGNDIVTGTFRGMYNATKGAGSIALMNLLTSLP